MKQFHVTHQMPVEGVLLLQQARAQAAKLPQYELHVLVAQPHAQEKTPQLSMQQPRMVLDGAELDVAMVNSLLDMASTKSAAASSQENIHYRKSHPLKHRQSQEYLRVIQVMRAALLCCMFGHSPIHSPSVTRRARLRYSV